MSESVRREGSLEAPTRHPIEWRSPQFTDPAALDKELARIFDICHGCRRCFSLCNAFPTLFDAVDATASGEVHDVPKEAYWQVVEHCYLCDMCYMTKCPYVPPHEWNVDFPHLMLRAKVKAFEDGKARFRDKFLSSTDTVGSLAGIPVVAEAVYYGFWYAAKLDALFAFIRQAQTPVTGEVKLNLYKGNLEVAGRTSPNNLYDEGIATMEGGGSYNQTDAEGFLRIQGLPVRVQGRVTPRSY